MAVSRRVFKPSYGPPGLFGSAGAGTSVETLELTDSFTMDDVDVVFEETFAVMDSFHMTETLTLEVLETCTNVYRVPARELCFKVPIPRIF